MSFPNNTIPQDSDSQVLTLKKILLALTTGGESPESTVSISQATPGVTNKVQSASVVVDPAALPSYSVGDVEFPGLDKSGNFLCDIRLLLASLDSVTVYAKQYTTQSTFTPVTSSGTVFTLAAGQKGVIQNLAAAALYVKYGATASSTSFSFILPACTLASDGTSPPFVIEDFVGVVSIKAAASTESAIAYILS